jgi:uncharacterized membrane protein
MSKRIIYNFLNDDELLRISNKIKETERKTSAEILVSIKEKRNLLEKGKSLRQLAEKEFYQSGITKTKDRTGVLIFILLSDRQFYILADKKISEKLEQKILDEIADEISQQFKAGMFASGIINCIERLGKILSNEFPINSDDINELSDKVLIK